MSRRISSESLIELAIATLRSEVAPHLQPEQRYQVAMVARALEIARREVLTDGDQARFDVLDRIYDDGEGSLEMLARDIRAGRVTTSTHADLEDLLRRLLVEELQIRNPKAVASAHERTGMQDRHDG